MWKFKTICTTYKKCLNFAFGTWNLMIIRIGTCFAIHNTHEKNEHFKQPCSTEMMVRFIVFGCCPQNIYFTNTNAMSEWSLHAWVVYGQILKLRHMHAGIRYAVVRKIYTAHNADLIQKKAFGLTEANFRKCGNALAGSLIKSYPWGLPLIMPWSRIR